jgi:hypothetical protein
MNIVGEPIESEKKKQRKIKESKESKESKEVNEKRQKKEPKKQKKINKEFPVGEKEENPVGEEKEKEKDSSIKRGRKPKGGKIVTMQIEEPSQQIEIPNVILHLKCSLKDLNQYNDQLNEMITDPLAYNPAVPPEIMTYNENLQPFSSYNDHSRSQNTESDHATSNPSAHYAYAPLYEKTNNFLEADTTKEITKKEKEDEDTNIKDIYAKLKQLRIQLYKNNISDKKSACFWCTCDFDNPACYIPKHTTDDSIHGYGSFCRPECAVGFLMNENIDDSAKFERYHLLNQIYSKVYGFKRNIKPAPNPHYLLEKYYGNLSIQEYRKLLKTEHMLLVIDKPMTRILPELHEDNDEFILNVYGGTKNAANNSTATVNTGVFKVKRQSEKQQGPSKSTLLKNKFGIA